MINNQLNYLLIISSREVLRKLSNKLVHGREVEDEEVDGGDEVDVEEVDGGDEVDVEEVDGGDEEGEVVVWC